MGQQLGLGKLLFICVEQSNNWRDPYDNWRDPYDNCLYGLNQTAARSFCDKILKSADHFHTRIRHIEF